MLKIIGEFVAGLPVKIAGGLSRSCPVRFFAFTVTVPCRVLCGRLLMVILINIQSGTLLGLVPV